MANLVPTLYADNEAASPSWVGAGGANTVTNDATQFVTGAKSCKIAVTTTSATYLEMNGADFFNVSVGTIYSFSMWLRSTVSRVWNATIYWYTSGGAFISQTSNLPITINTSWNQLTYICTPPATAGKARISTNGSGTISDVYIDDIQFDTYTGNLTPNGFADNEGVDPVWINAGGGATISNSSTYAYTGSKSLKFVPSSASPTYFEMPAALRFPITASVRYSFSFWLRNTGTGAIRAQVQWYNSGGGVISSDDIINGSVAFSDFTLVAADLTAPAGAVAARLACYTSAVQDYYLDDFKAFATNNSKGFLF